MGVKLRRSKDCVGEGHATFFTAFSYDLLLTCVILGILACFAVNCALQTMKKAEVTAALGRASNYKKSVLVYYTVYGQMPDSITDIETAGIYKTWGDPSDRYDSQYGPIVIEQGAIHIPLKKGTDAMLSWRPAVLRTNPTGSIIWVIGDYFDANRWQAFGTDRTNVSDYALNSFYYTD